jgi:hypothetical protein
MQRQPQSYMALGATQDHKDSAVLVEADLKELAESLGQILRLRLPCIRVANSGPQTRSVQDDNLDSIA